MIGFNLSARMCLPSRRPMHIAINALSVVPDSTGGGEIYLVNLVCHLLALDKKNHYTLLVTGANRHLFASEQSNCTIVPIGRTSLTAPIRIAVENVVIPLLLAKLKVNVYHSPTDVLPWFLPCRSVLTMQNGLHFRWIEHFSLAGTTLFERLKARSWILYYHFGVPRALKSSTRIIAVSKYIAEEILAYMPNIPPAKVAVVYEAVDPVFVRNPHKTRQSVSTPYVLCVSALLPHKYIENTLEAFALLKQRYSVFHSLIIAGSGPKFYKRRLDHLLEERKIQGDVKFVGFVPRARMPALYGNADLFITLASAESFCLPVLEAMACGVPVVASNRSALPEIVGEAGILVDPFDVAAVAAAMYEALSSDTLRENLRRRGEARVRDFSWERAAAQTLAVYEQAAAS